MLEVADAAGVKHDLRERKRGRLFCCSQAGKGKEQRANKQGANPELPVDQS